MKKKHPIILFSCLILGFTAWISAGGQPVESGSFTEQVISTEVSGQLAVLDAGISVRDVTREYSSRLAGSRADEDHYFLTALGGTGHESGQAGILTSDGGAITVGYTYNFTVNQFRVLVAKFSNDGILEWGRTVGDGWDYGYAICETSGGDYVVAGRTEMNGAGESDILLVKLNNAGTPQWFRTVGGSAGDGAYGVCETTTGEIVVAGYTYSFGSGDADALLAGFDGNGTLSWATRVSGSGEDALYSIRTTADGGFICAGSTRSYGAGSADAFLLRFTGGGGLLWAETLGGEFIDQGKDALESSSGDIVLTGHTSEGSGAADVLFAVFAADGSLISAATVGGSPNGDYGNTLCELAGGGYAVAGTSYNFGPGSSNALLLTFDSYGSYQWARVYGGSETNLAYAVQELPGGGFLLVGETSSFGFYGTGDGNFLLVATDQSGLVPGCEYSTGCYPDVANPLFTVTAAEPSVSSPTLGVDTTSVYWSLVYPPNEVVCDFTPPEKRYWLAASGEWNSESGQAIGQTPDGGFIVAADGASYMAGTQNDFLMLKYDALGDLQWASLAGGDHADVPRDLAITEDGGCIVVGFTYSFGVGSTDGLVMSFDAAGGLNWAKTVGSSGQDSARSVRKIPSGDYLVAGGTEMVTTGDQQALAYVIDAAGDIQWIRAVGAVDRAELAYCGIGTADGGTLLAGAYNNDGLMIKLDADGNLVWNGIHGSGGTDTFYAILTMPDGNYILGGQTTSYGSADAYFVKINGTTGGRMWVRSSGSSHFEHYYDMRETSDGGIIAAGFVLPPSVIHTHALLCKFDGEGMPVWSHEVNGDGTSDFLGVVETADGGFAAAGRTTAFGAGMGDAFVIHTDRNGRVGDCPYIWEREYGTGTHYPPQGGYAMVSQIPAMSIYTQSPATMMPAVQNEEICSAVPTTAGSFACTPAQGIAPFTTSMQAALVNQYDGITRRIAGRINLVLASGGYFPNWRAGFTNIAPGETYVASWNQNIPALAALDGENRFVLLAEDVTPAPYNQPPYPPSGDVDTDVFTLQVTVP